VVPVSLGGIRAIPLCIDCHALVHGAGTVFRPDLIRAGIAKARAAGTVIGAPVKATPPIAAEVIKARALGQSIRAIAKTHSLSIGTVHGICMRNNENENQPVR